MTGPVAGVWHYEYAIYNENLDRGIQSFSVPCCSSRCAESRLSKTRISRAASIIPDFPTMEPRETRDLATLPGLRIKPPARLSWSTETFAQNQNANAIRWGTLYNFRFDSDQPPAGDECDDRLLQDGNANHRRNPGSWPSWWTLSTPTPTSTPDTNPTPSPTPISTPTPTPAAPRASIFRLACWFRRTMRRHRRVHHHGKRSKASTASRPRTISM